MTKEERELCDIAERDPDDEKANEAMKTLREKYDKTYFWCDDCDGLVTTEADCCMNIKRKKK